MKPLYLDYMATTPIDPAVAAAMLPYITGVDGFGNPASEHVYGERTAAAVQQARQQVANLLNCDTRCVVFTSGATEADNLAILGAAEFYQSHGRHIVTLKTEHKAVLACCAELERRGFEVTYLDVQPNGLVDLNVLEASLREDTILVSVMHVNNEIGVIQDITAIGKLLRERGVLFHVDAAQSFGKLPLDLATLPVDLLAFSGHKIYGPKGIGGLYVRRKPKVRLQPQIVGGGQEFGLRAGTLPVHQIVGMGVAAQVAQANLQTEQARILALRNHLWQQLQQLPGVTLNGDLEQRIAGNLNISVDCVEGESLQYAVRDIAVSSGSACNAATFEPSHVLLAIGRSATQAHSALRISMGRFTTAADVDHAAAVVMQAITRLRQLSPRWQAVAQQAAVEVCV